MPELPKYLKVQYFNIVDDQNGVQADQNCLWKKRLYFLARLSFASQHGGICSKNKQNAITITWLLFFDFDQSYDFIKQYYLFEFANLFQGCCIYPVMQSDIFRFCYLLQIY